MPICHARNSPFRVSLRGHKPPPGPRELQTIGDHLRRRRLELGLRQADLASRLGVSPKTIRNWEAGHRTPTGRSLGPIRNFLGYDPCPDRSSVAQRLREYRFARAWTRADLAAALGVRTVTVSRWDRGRTVPRREFLARVLALLDTSATTGACDGSAEAETTERPAV